MNYLVEFGMDCIEIDENTYKVLQDCFARPGVVWVHLVDVNKDHFDINLFAIKYISRKPVEKAE